MERFIGSLSKHGPFGLALAACLFITIDNNSARLKESQDRLREAREQRAELTKLIQENTQANGHMSVAIEQNSKLLEAFIRRSY